MVEKGGTPCRMSLNRIGVVNQIFSVPTEKGKKVLIMVKEYVEREVISEGIRKYYYKNPPNSSYEEGFDHGLDKAQRVILNAPVADVAPVVHGRWVNTHSDSEFAQCSLCKYPVYAAWIWNLTNYCPNCGAKMDL